MKYIVMPIIALGLCACGSVSNYEQVSEPTTESVKAAVNTSAETNKLEVIEVFQPEIALLQSLANDFSWERHLEKPEVQKRIKSYKRKPKQFEQILARSSEFLPIITEKLKARNMPTELAFLPMVESGYQTSIYSRSGAAGLWQIMPATAKHLGLKINWWYDERLDIDASTDKALDYLEYLNKQFNGDWELAITAYNGGEGHVRSRMRKAKSKDFWKLSLKRETEDYLPRLLAVAELVSQPGKYAINLPVIDKQSNLKHIEFDYQIDLRLAAQTANMDYQKFKILNPSFQRWISPPTGSYSLLLPKDSAIKIATKLPNLQPDQLASWDHYRVKSGDTLIEIAREFGTTVRALIAVNELSNSRIYARQELLIPSFKLQSTANRPDTIKELYIVQSGDSLWKIANRNNLSIATLKKLNSIRANQVIQPGQVLILSEYFDGKEVTYEVKKGDSLSVIAHQFDVAIADLKSWNEIGKKDLIHPGQVLKIRSKS